MPVTISAGYREQNTRLHKTAGLYGASGQKNADEVHRLLKKYAAVDVLDYGCGKGMLREKMGKVVRNYDPALNQFSSDPEPADIVVCADVMEHVEPEFMDAVMDHIASLAKKCAYFVISCAESKKTLPDGRNSHISIHPSAWWDEKLASRFEIKRSNPMQRDAIEYVCEPKCSP